MFLNAGPAGHGIIESLNESQGLINQANLLVSAPGRLMKSLLVGNVDTCRPGVKILEVDVGGGTETGIYNIFSCDVQGY